MEHVDHLRSERRRFSRGYRKLELDFPIPKELSDAINEMVDFVNFQRDCSAEDAYRTEIDCILRYYRKRFLPEQMPVNWILTKGGRGYKINNYKDISRLPMNKEQTAIPCCPYCKSRIGYEKREAIQWYWYYAADGTPDGHSEPRTIKELSWENPRCMNCGRPLMEVDIPFL